MNDATRLTNLEITGNLEVRGDLSLGAERSAYTVTAANADQAADAAPTKAEFDAVVALVNEIKADHNALVSKLIPSGS